MSTYEAGTVAVATVNGVPNVRVMRVRAASPPAAWVTAEHLPGCGAWWNDADLTDIRPLVVLDLADPSGAVESLREGVADDLWTGDAAACIESIADQIEAQTKPPRIPEPGLWGVVEATYCHTRRKFVRMVTGISDEQWSDDESAWADWDSLEDPILVRPGIEDES